MAFEVSQSMLTALQAAAESNVLSVSHNGKTVQFSSFAELRERIEWLERRLASATDRPRVVYVQRKG